MNVRPLHDRLIVQRLDESVQRAGGISIPHSAEETDAADTQKGS